MATNVQRFCVLCDMRVKRIKEPSKVIGRDELGSDQIFVHAVGVGRCGRRTLSESQTYTMGDADTSDEE